MDSAGTRLSFSYTNIAGRFDPPPLISQQDISVALLEEMLEAEPDKEFRNESLSVPSSDNNKGTDQAVSKIFEILVGLELEKTNNALNSYLHKREIKAAAIQEFFDTSKEWSNPDSRSVQIGIITAITQGAANGDAQSQEMLDAFNSGTLNIEDMADYGLKTESKLVVYLDDQGNYVFGTSSVDYTGEYTSPSELFSDLTTLNEDGQLIDIATGLNAAFIGIGINLHFYITWPSQ
ncbi:hypothetical protein PsAD2_00091 [Pseudovibrio axinellae]|uniref:Uncharacterized protein n=1 Tax=Pseudovibrio axinellae TaxID=989403 RepID=A0A166BAF7_9HYPH|nr:hypothetical protein [Pseudovibrio axinellae]KZL22066.1 hypothetical protein PsAD2_00091 [Pseudovibrio axinellae]SEQ56548.1 hypothetical protein SAMN05421798_103108 [Pseudovibrio axinellae]